MASLFSITPTPPTTAKIAAGQTATFSFTVTSMAAPDEVQEVVLQALLVGDDGKGKAVAWVVVSSRHALAIAGDKTETVTVSVRPTGDTPRGEHRIRLVVADKYQPNEMYTESQTVACEVEGAVVPPPPPRKFPWWVIAAGAAGVIVVGVVVWQLLPSKSDPPKRAGLGESCSATILCEDGLSCDPGTRVCVAPPAQCSPPSQLCGAACINIAESAANCGRCGHDCGGGTCVGGRCQPVTIADAADELDAPAALALDASTIYWVEHTRVRSCPLPLGCALEPKLIADTYSQLKAIAVSRTSVYFSACTACDDHAEVYKCPLDGCPARATRVVSTLLNGFDTLLVTRSHLYAREVTEAIRGCELPDCPAPVQWKQKLFGGDITAIASDGDTVYVKSGDLDLRTCPEAVGCAAPATLPSSSGIAAPFRVHAGKAYYLAVGPNSQFVYRCDVQNCTQRTQFAAETHGATEIEVDGSGVYWLNPATGRVRHCPLDGCPPGGAVTLASGRVNPKVLTLGDGFLYWIEGNTILKLVKP